MTNPEAPTYSDDDLEFVVTGLDLDDSRRSKQPIERNEAALDAVAHALKLLRAEALNGWALDMVTSFLQGVVDNKDTKLAVKIAGVQPRKGGRPPADRVHRLALWAFRQALERGASEEEAMPIAYDTWNGPGAYADDSRKTIARDGKDTTRAAAFIEDTLAPALRKAGLIARKPSGRPRKTAPNI